MRLPDYLRAWIAAERRAFAGSWKAVPIWYRAAGSKLVSGLGAAIAVVSAICLSNADAVTQLAPRHGARFCAVTAILGTLLAWFGKPALDRRKDPGSPPAPPGGQP